MRFLPPKINTHGKRTARAARFSFPKGENIGETLKNLSVPADNIVTAVEKKHLLLFNLWGDASPHRP